MPPGFHMELKFKGDFPVNPIDVYLFLALVILCARDGLASAIPGTHLPSTTLKMNPGMIREGTNKSGLFSPKLWVGGSQES